ncbi:hypothetical protein ThesiDRAFT1_1586 [Thermoanaerobacter siderophilus SR4]|uniref:Uncharacterized protein n=1 Tax=Thermoanaerobacter siderophilus SR4 TaxID=880478 RepID=I9KUG7_9THEO|nr:hypothetical protein ThesiDRAFT1_1586 [Thermoanaerobacter siderophilus SR4]
MRQMILYKYEIDNLLTLNLRGFYFGMKFEY